MKLLLDENVPRPMAEIVRILLKGHEVAHVHDLKGWAGTKDVELYAMAKAEGFHAVITNDTKQLSRPLEVAAIASSGLHRIEYRQNNKHGGLVGLGTAIATICAGLPHALTELADADGQRLISLNAIDPSRQSRMRITNPTTTPPKFWTGR
ncbi:DUF5615 family PIN-like protein [Actinacidiphila oryziradicis]|uniref:VapC45 PIN like domain-containing protein n=1 Tax=Actinacidiphila oryziradicis TaxID=2571141 RepID=A0A4U0SNK5_9ACTN|nr:DUF5615 family PIN-like protein [Actinacidiphila oryziradicis]TKA11432.1 hypothetical protein FCI23_11420 [Actinacidiphila oryziradicis]